MEKGKKWKKNGKKQNAFLLHNKVQLSVGVNKTWRLTVIGPKKSVTKTFIGEKEKWTNKGNDKYDDADSLLHKTTSRIQCLYQISKSKVQ